MAGLLPALIRDFRFPPWTPHAFEAIIRHLSRHHTEHAGHTQYMSAGAANKPLDWVLQTEGAVLFPEGAPPLPETAAWLPSLLAQS